VRHGGVCSDDQIQARNDVGEVGKVVDGIAELGDEVTSPGRLDLGRV
jgi:hypothetical protein